MKNKPTSKDKIKKLNDGKFFEMIVECLQLLLAADGVKVTRRREFFSEGKKVGEVDVVIEGRIGSANIMIGVECRDRQEIPGVDWIQQIMGRRLALAKFGFNHWIAVSRKGFTSTAIALAKEQNIELLIPGIVEPVDKNKSGFHTFMQLSMTYPCWKPNQFFGKMVFDDEKISEELMDEIEEILKTNPPNLNKAGLKPISLRDFIKPTVDEYCVNLEKLNKTDTTYNQIFKFHNLDASINGVEFKFDEIDIGVDFYEKTVHPNFQIMAFTIPEIEKLPKKILAIIGINEFEPFGDIAYLMVGIKPEKPNAFKFILRDSEGKPIGNRAVQLNIPHFYKIAPPKT